MRFDLRAPENGAPAADLYAAALEMAGWAETRGCLAAVACEHHLSEDGYLPEPLTLATALAARTTSLPVMVAVLLLPLYDPVRLAERMAVIDILSRGRVSYVAAIGYRPEEYELYGVDFHRRGAIAEEKLTALFAALETVTPRARPSIFWGGGSPPAARRAGRFGLGFFAQGGGQELQQVYEQAAREAGHEPGFCYIPPTDAATILGVDEAIETVRAGTPLNLHPLVGGLPRRRSPGAT